MVLVVAFHILLVSLDALGFLLGLILRISLPLGFRSGTILATFLTLLFVILLKFRSCSRIGLCRLFERRQFAFLTLLSAFVFSSLSSSFLGLPHGGEFFLADLRYGREIVADEVEVDIELLFSGFSMPTVRSMNNDLIDEFIEHIIGQLSDVLILLYKSHKTVDVCPLRGNVRLLRL